MRERGTCLSEYVACLKQAGTDFNEQTFLKPNGKFWMKFNIFTNWRFVYRKVESKETLIKINILITGRGFNAGKSVREIIYPLNDPPFSGRFNKREP